MSEPQLKSSTVPTERAEEVESTAPDERAINGESTVMLERAVTAEKYRGPRASRIWREVPKTPSEPFTERSTDSLGASRT